MLKTLSLVLATAIATTSYATPQDQVGHSCPMTRSVAASTQTPPGPSALTETQVQQLLAGEGMGQATAAERNGYPGPKHVLELAEALKLTPEQHARITGAFERMRVDVQELGTLMIQAERDLFAAFESRSVRETDLERLTMRIGHLQARLRARHLKAHVESMPVLTKEQVAAYRELRGHAGH